jgi:hypothetical protein
MLHLRRALFASKIRRQTVQKPIVQRQWTLRFYSASLPPQEYHRLADDTMDKLTSELETLLEENDIPGSDVEYSVCNIGKTLICRAAC